LPYYLYLLIMELRFDAMLYSNLGNENSDAGHIKRSREPQVPHPCLTTRFDFLSSCRFRRSVSTGFHWHCK